MATLETKAFINSVTKSANGNFFVNISYLTGRKVNDKKQTQYLSCMATKKMQPFFAEVYDSQKKKDGGKFEHSLSNKMMSVKVRDPHFYLYEGDMKTSLQSNGLLIQCDPYDPVNQ